MTKRRFWIEMSSVALTLGALALAGGSSAYWAAFDKVPVTIESKVDRIGPVVPGQVVAYSREICSESTLEAEQQYVFINNVMLESEKVKVTIEEGCRRELVTFTIPKTLSPGVYDFAVKLEYRANPIRQVATNHYQFDLEVKG